MAWTRNKRLDEEAIGESKELAVAINRLAEECWMDYRDVRLEAIARDSKKIHSLLSDVYRRQFMEQEEMFEAVGSRGPEHNPQVKEKQ